MDGKSEQWSRRTPFDRASLQSAQIYSRRKAVRFEQRLNGAGVNEAPSQTSNQATEPHAATLKERREFATHFSFKQSFGTTEQVAHSALMQAQWEANWLPLYNHIH